MRKKLGEYIQRNEKEEAKKYCEELEAKSPDKKIKAEYLQGTKEEASREELQWEEKLDWSIFEKETWNFQQGNGTQEGIHSIGKYKDILMS